MTEQLLLDLDARPAAAPAPEAPAAPLPERLVMEARDGQVMVRLASADEPPPATIWNAWVAFFVPSEGTAPRTPIEVAADDQAHAEEIGAAIFEVPRDQVFAAPASLFPPGEPLPLTLPIVAVTCPACSATTRLIRGGIEKCDCGKVLTAWEERPEVPKAPEPVPAAPRPQENPLADLEALSREIAEELEEAADIQRDLEADFARGPRNADTNPFERADVVLRSDVTGDNSGGAGWAVFELAGPDDIPIHTVPVDTVLAALTPRERRGLLRAFRRVVNPPIEPTNPGDAILQGLREHNERLAEDSADLRALHAQIVGVPVEELDAHLAAEKAAEEARKPPKPVRPRGSLGKRAKAAPDATPEEAARRALTERQRELLSVVVVEDDRATFGPDQHIPDWGALKIVLEALGGTYQPGGRGKGWTRRKGSFTFPAGVNVEETIRLAHETGEIFDPKLAGLFETPEALADDLVARLPIVPGCVVLEPEAGRGRIALAVRRHCPEARVLCIEALADNRAELRRLGFEVIGGEDFLTLRAADLPVPIDVVAANPPFGRGEDVRHVEHALGLLRPGGHLGAIMSGSVEHVRHEPFTSFRARIAAWGGTIERNPDGSFLESGTGVRTVTVVLQKPMT